MSLYIMLFASLILGILSVIDPCFFYVPKNNQFSASAVELEF